MTTTTATTTNYLSSSDSGFSPEIWGPMLWPVLHLVAHKFPINPTENDRDEYHAFFRSLGSVLPCGGCAKSYFSLIRDETSSSLLTRKVFESRRSLVLWLHAIHNTINAKESINKAPVALEGAIAFFDSLRSDSSRGDYRGEVMIVQNGLVNQERKQRNGGDSRNHSMFVVESRKTPWLAVSFQK